MLKFSNYENSLLNHETILKPQIFKSKAHNV